MNVGCHIEEGLFQIRGNSLLNINHSVAIAIFSLTLSSDPSYNMDTNIVVDLCSSSSPSPSPPPPPSHHTPYLFDYFIAKIHEAMTHAPPPGNDDLQKRFLKGLELEYVSHVVTLPSWSIFTT